MARIFTTEISENEYIGDSLTTINTNFNTLDTSCQVISSFFASGSAGVAQIIAGTNITLSPVNGSGIVTINSTGGNGTDTEVRALTSNWESTYTTVRDTSSSWSGSLTSIISETNISGLSSTETYYYLNSNSDRGIISTSTKVFPDTGDFTLSANKIYEVNWDIFNNSENYSNIFSLSASNTFANVNMFITAAIDLTSTGNAAPTIKGTLLQTNNIINLQPVGFSSSIFGPWSGNYGTIKAIIETSDITTICLTVSGDSRAGGSFTTLKGSKGNAKWIGNA